MTRRSAVVVPLAHTPPRRVLSLFAQRRVKRSGASAMQRSAPQPAVLSSRHALRGTASSMTTAPQHRRALRDARPVRVHAEAMKSSRWKSAFELLTERKVKGVSAAEAANLMRWPRSYVLVDVRRTDQYAVYHAVPSRNAPLYRLISPTTPWQAIRAAAFQAQNVDPVEDNPEAVESLRAALAGSGGAIFVDAEGGSLESTQTRPYGLVSRSLLGAWQALALCGYKGTVLHLEGGLNAWFAAGLAGEGTDEEWAFSGKTPSSSFAPRK